ncbi:MAG: flagellar assembly protein FliW [Rhodovibrio sp.]|nr:flagellar assembly protein FliW [Rhodovibrio sp.]
MTYQSQLAIARTSDTEPADAVTQTADSSTPAGVGPNDLEVATRFGVYAVEADKTLRFERGLLGFAQPGSFALLDLPGEAPQAFRLLQKVDDANLGFIVLPLAGELEADAEADLQALCEARHVKRADAVFLLIATLRPKAEGGVDITVNRRAPILLDGRRMTGAQVVLNDPRYEVRYTL